MYVAVLSIISLSVLVSLDYNCQKDEAEEAYYTSEAKVTKSTCQNQWRSLPKLVEREEWIQDDGANELEEASDGEKQSNEEACHGVRTLS